MLRREFFKNLLVAASVLGLGDRVFGKIIKTVPVHEKFIKPTLIYMAFVHGPKSHKTLGFCDAYTFNTVYHSKSLKILKIYWENDKKTLLDKFNKDKIKLLKRMRTI